LQISVYPSGSSLIYRRGKKNNTHRKKGGARRHHTQNNRRRYEDGSTTKRREQHFKNPQDQKKAAHQAVHPKGHAAEGESRVIGSVKSAFQSKKNITFSLFSRLAVFR